MMHPPFRARALPQLRAELLEPGPRVFGSDVPMMEMSQLLSPEQRLRPAGHRYGGEVDAEAAKKLEAWHQHCVASSYLYWVEPALIRYAWAAEPSTGPLPLAETFTDLPDYGLCVFGEPIEVPLPDGRTTPITAVSWAPMSDVPWNAEIFSSEGFGGSGVPTRAPFPDAATQDQWRHLRFFTLGLSGPLAVILKEAGYHQASLYEEFDLPLECAPEIEPVPHARPGVMEGSGDIYNMPRALHIAFLLARSPRVGQTSTEAVMRSERRRAAKRGLPYPDGDDAQIKMMSMRPAVRDAVLGSSGTDQAGTDGVFRRPARYSLPIWYVSPSKDPVTGSIKKKGYWAARNPELLADAPAAEIVHTASLPKRP
jgi:hypothetical protein